MLARPNSVVKLLVLTIRGDPDVIHELECISQDDELCTNIRRALPMTDADDSLTIYTHMVIESMSHEVERLSTHLVDTRGWQESLSIFHKYNLQFPPMYDINT